MLRFALTALVLAAPLASTAVAAPPLTLPAGKLNVALNAELGMNDGAAAEPISLSPDVSYGVSDALTATKTLGSGIKGPVQGFGDAWEVPLGFMGQYAVDPSLGLGASLVFGKVVGGADATGFDYRGVQLWASYTM